MPLPHYFPPIHMFSAQVPQQNEELLSVRSIIRSARGSRTQETFARELGIRQDLLCKYEKGRVNPPSVIVERCMHKIHTTPLPPTPSAEFIAHRITTELAAPEQEIARIAILKLIDAFTLMGHKN